MSRSPKFLLQSNFQQFTESRFTSILCHEIPSMLLSHNFSNFTKNLQYTQMVKLYYFSKDTDAKSWQNAPLIVFYFGIFSLNCIIQLKFVAELGSGTSSEDYSGNWLIIMHIPIRRKIFREINLQKESWFHEIFAKHHECKIP